MAHIPFSQRRRHVLEVLALGAAEPEEIAAHAQLPVSTTLRLLRQLRREGLVRQAEDVYGLTELGLDVLRARQE